MVLNESHEFQLLNKRTNWHLISIVAKLTATWDNTHYQSNTKQCAQTFKVQLNTLIHIKCMVQHKGAALYSLQNITSYVLFFFIQSLIWPTQTADFFFCHTIVWGKWCHEWLLGTLAIQPVKPELPVSVLVLWVCLKCLTASYLVHCTGTCSGVYWTILHLT